MTARPAALLAALVLVGACRTTTTTTTTVSGTPVVTPVPAPAPAEAAPAPAGAVDPVGRWTLALSAQGQSFEVVLELVKLPAGGYGGSLSSDAFPTIPISKGILEGKRLTLTFPVPTGGDGSMFLDIDGDVAAGEWAMQGDGSKVSGKRG
jgi:hypothetical protein